MGLNITRKDWSYLIKRIIILGDDLLDFLFPVYCEICNLRLQRERYICQVCLNKITYLTPPCSLSRREPLVLQNEMMSKDGQESKQYLEEKVISLGKYEGILKDYLHLLKYNHKPYLEVLFPKIIKEDYLFWIKPYQFDYIIPVPLHPKKLRSRGYNQAELIAKYLSKVYKISLSKNNLRRKRETLPQVNLGKKERFDNVKDSFTVKDKEKLKDKRVLLVDDVYTTGSTVNECYQELKKSKVRKVIILTLARS
ncbi:ComF family protein [bacterium]|nr:ComF family protein [bacterium]